MLLSTPIKSKLVICCLILLFPFASQTPVFADIVPRASKCTKHKFPISNDEFDRARLLNCYDTLWAKPDGTIFYTTSFEVWWLDCREKFADDDNARLECFVDNNNWDVATN